MGHARLATNTLLKEPETGQEGQEQGRKDFQKRPACQSWPVFRSALDRARRAGRAGFSKTI
jgi:hypothetical protein